MNPPEFAGTTGDLVRVSLAVLGGSSIRIGLRILLMLVVDLETATKEIEAFDDDFRKLFRADCLPFREEECDCVGFDEAAAMVGGGAVRSKISAFCASGEVIDEVVVVVADCVRSGGGTEFSTNDLYSISSRGDHDLEAGVRVDRGVL